MPGQGTFFVDSATKDCHPQISFRKFEPMVSNWEECDEMISDLRFYQRKLQAELAAELSRAMHASANRSATLKKKTVVSSLDQSAAALHNFMEDIRLPAQKIATPPPVGQTENWQSHFCYRSRVVRKVPGVGGVKALMLRMRPKLTVSTAVEFKADQERTVLENSISFEFVSFAPDLPLPAAMVSPDSSNSPDPPAAVTPPTRSPLPPPPPPPPPRPPMLAPSYGRASQDDPDKWNAAAPPPLSHLEMIRTGKLGLRRPSSWKALAPKPVQANTDDLSVADLQRALQQVREAMHCSEDSRGSSSSEASSSW
jgi:hypothetical protein